MSSDINFKVLREQLPWGAQADIAKKHGVSPSYVNQVLFERSVNLEILRDLLIAAKEYQKKLKQVRNEIETLTDGDD